MSRAYRWLLLPILLAASASAQTEADAWPALQRCMRAAASGDQAGTEAAVAQARAEVGRALTEQPSSTAHLAMARVVLHCEIPFASMMDRVGLATEAERHLQTALELEPEGVDARFLYGALLYNLPAFLGRADEAQQHLQRVVEQLEALPPDAGGPGPKRPSTDLAQAWLMLGDLHRRSGEEQQAKAVWRRGLKRFPAHRELAARMESVPSVQESPHGEQASPPSEPPTESRLPAGAADMVETMEGLLRRELRKPGQAGLAVAVAQGGKTLLLRGHGLAELELQVPMTQRSVLRIGSLSKQFLAVAALRMVREGVLPLHQPLDKWLPELGKGPDITLHHLLSHTAGLPRGIRSGNAEADWISRSLAAPRRPPGQGYRYSNLGYALAGVALERASGQSWSALLETYALEPAQLEETRLCDPIALIAGRAEGYQVRGDGLANDEPWVFGPGLRFAGGICSSARDLLRWQQQLRDGSLLSRATWERMRSPAQVSQGESTYGYGVYNRQLEGLQVVHHSGAVPGFLCELAYYPDLDLDVVVLSNSEGSDPRALARSLAGVAADSGSVAAEASGQARARDSARVSSSPTATPRGKR